MALSLSSDDYHFLEWWHASRGEHILPCRSKLVLEQIARFLPRMTVLDAVSPEQMVFRLTGTKVDQNAGANGRGINVLEVTPEADRKLRGLRLWNLASQPCIGVFCFNMGIAPDNSVPVTGVTVPVRAQGEGTPVQLFTLLTEPEKQNAGPRGDRLSAVSMPDAFAYVDIGNGAPNDDSGDVMKLDQVLLPESAVAEAV